MAKNAVKVSTELKSSPTGQQSTPVPSDLIEVGPDLAKPKPMPMPNEDASLPVGPPAGTTAEAGSDVMPMSDYPHGRGGMDVVPIGSGDPPSQSGGSIETRRTPEASEMPS